MRSDCGAPQKTRLLIVAGEASADVHGAALLRELKHLLPQVEAFGAGGKELATEGMEIKVSAEQLSIVGVTGWWDKLGGVLKAFRQLVRLAREERPSAAILLDLPDFNLRLARKLKRLGIPVIYYISPQVWAWRRYRVKNIKRNIDRMLVLFPFEKDFYDQFGVSVEFVGHPLLDSLSLRSGYRADEEIISAPRIALLPGSRVNEIKFHGPILKEVARQIRQIYPEAQFQVPVASTLDRGFVESTVGAPAISFVDGNANGVLRWADIAVVASGTATLETALVGTPFCLIYKVSSVNAWILRVLAKYRGAIGMPNLLLGKKAVKEFFQEEADPQAIAGECLRMIRDSQYRNNLAEQLKLCRDHLGSAGASRKAALSVRNFLVSVEPKSGASLGLAPQMA